MPTVPSPRLAAGQEPVALRTDDGIEPSLNSFTQPGATMTATVPTMTNGRAPRKQLSDQLDRLDSIIDGLCDGLPAAVAAAAQEGTRQAVKDAIVEIISNPELRGLMQSFAPAVPTPAPAMTVTESAPT